MSHAQPDSMRGGVNQRERAGQCDKTSESLRERNRRHPPHQAGKRLRELIEEGLNSGPGQALTPRRVARLKNEALGILR
jgi:antitoxin ParD1/3/4